MTNVINLEDHRKPATPSNGAREAIHTYFNGIMAKGSHGYHISIADHFLMHLWLEGFKVVPLESKDKEAS